MKVCLQELHVDSENLSAFEAAEDTLELAGKDRKTKIALLGEIRTFAEQRARPDVLSKLLAALTAFESQNHKETELILGELEHQSPDDSRVYSLLARLFLVKGEVAKADNAAQSALEIDPFSASAGIVMARVMIARKQYVSAWEILQNIKARSGVHRATTALLEKEVEANMLKSGQGIIRGRCVRADNGKPVIGAMVQATTQAGNTRRKRLAGTPEFLSVTSTMPDGGFVLKNVPAGKFYLKAYYRGLIVQSPVAAVVRKDVSTDLVTLSLSEGFGLKVTVLDSVSKRPLVAANVKLEAGGATDEATTGASGDVRFTGLQRDSYRLIVTAPSYMKRQSSVSFLSAEMSAQRQVTVALPKGVMVTGKLTDASGRPVADAKIVLAGESGAIRSVGEAPLLTGPDGMYYLDGISPGTTFRVVAFKANSGYAMSESHEGKAGDALKLNLQFKAPIRLSGKVVDDVGKPVVNARVILKLRTSLPFQEARTSLTTFTDGLGKFSFAKLTSGPYMIIATNPGHVSPGFQDLEPEEMSAEITMKVFRSQSITGTVKDNQGNPVEGVLVYVLNYKGLNARTDAAGRYTVSGLLPQDYSLLAIRKTYKSVKLPGVKSGSKGVDFVLHKK